MIQNVLQQRLQPLIEAELTLRRRKTISLVFLLGFLLIAGLLVGALAFEWGTFGTALLLIGGVIVVALIAASVTNSRKIEAKSVVQKIEESHPDLRAALLTAIEQKPNADGKLGYLQERVVFDAVDHAIKNDWVQNVSSKRLLRAGFFQALALISFALLSVTLLSELFRQHTVPIAKDSTVIEEPIPDPGDYQIEVLPGDAEVERGARLIVEAAFKGERIPPRATVVVSDPGGEGAERGRISMKPGLDEAIFSGMIAKVDSDAVYRIEFDGETSDDFNITTFVHPKLEQADATISPPEYAKQPAKTVEDTRKVSVLEGSELAWSMKLNKPVAAGELFGEDETAIELKPSPEDPTVLISSHLPEKTQKYRLHLVDSEDRSNKRPPWFSVTVKKNLPPKLEFVFPKRDVQVSAIQELPVEAKVWDDLGVTKTGATFDFGTETREVALNDAALKGGEHHGLSTLFTLEEIGAQPRDLVSYHLWAEDIGPDGKPRRTMSDMFFAEVRHFEDIFREAEPPPGGEGEGGNQATKLLKLQKEVMNASWKLIRRQEMGREIAELADDIGVVQESQGIAREMTLEAIEEAEDPEFKIYLTEAKDFMEQAEEELGNSISKSSSKLLVAAHGLEKDAYASLLKAQAREHNITRQQSSQSQGQGQEMEQQMMELEMKQKDKLYEEESKAQEAQTPEQQENLVVLNRLKELAKRQEAIAEKIKELQTALEEAETPEEKEELERQLKRLQEEQKELLRELDNLTERMDSEENRANMTQEREKLEETRENVKEASEKLDEGNLADAANAATRAERELNEVKDDFREKTSKQFAEEIESIRDKARQLASQQKEIGEELENAEPDATPAESQKLANKIVEQQKTLETLLEEMRELSEASDTSEPLLSNALYEAVRDARTNAIDDSLSEAKSLTSYGRSEMAQEAERAAARGIEQLKENAEKAAEMVLGSEADAMRMARSELEDLIEQSREEAEQLAGNESEQQQSGERDAAPSESESGQPNGETGKQPGQGEGEQLAQNGKGKGDSKGQSEEPGEGEGMAENGKGKGKGQQPGEGQGESDQLADGGKGKGKGKGQGDQPGEGGEQPSESPGKGKGKGKGQGEGQGESDQLAEAQGKGKGKGKGQSQSPGEGEGEGQEGQGKGKGKGSGKSQGYRQGFAGTQPGQDQQGSMAGGASNGSSFGGPNNGGGEENRRGGLPNGLAQGGKPLFFNSPQEASPEAGPITGEDYEEWADRLRNVESMIGEEDLRNEVARVLDEARAMRIDYRSDNLPPQANTIVNKITNPLVEIRNRVAEELAKLDKENPLAPIDRDPVPQEYRELVRKYYQQLGSGD